MTAAPQPVPHDSSAAHPQSAPEPISTPHTPPPTLSITPVRLSLKNRQSGEHPGLLDPAPWGAEVDVPWWLPTVFRFFEPESN